MAENGQPRGLFVVWSLKEKKRLVNGDFNCVFDLLVGEMLETIGWC